MSASGCCTSAAPAASFAPPSAFRTAVGGRDHVPRSRGRSESLYGDGTCVEQGGILGNGTRRVFTWTKEAPDLIVVDTSSAPAGVCYIVTIQAIRGSFASGSFSAQTDEAAGCNTGFTREFTLTGGDVPY